MACGMSFPLYVVTPIATVLDGGTNGNDVGFAGYAYFFLPRQHRNRRKWPTLVI
jgi:hypothetical protein